MTTVAFEIPWNLGEGGSNLSNDGGNGLLRALRSIVADLDEVKSKFDAHKHQVDGSALSATSDITGGPVTGTTTGSPDGGTVTDVTVGTTVESGIDRRLGIDV